jgi:hypothetical protein
VGTTLVETSVVEDAVVGQTLIGTPQEDAKVDEEAGQAEV